MFYFCCGCIAPSGSVGNGAASQKGKGKHPPCHGKREENGEQVHEEEAEDKGEVVLAGLPPARKRAQQQSSVEAVHEDEGEAEHVGGEEGSVVELAELVSSGDGVGAIFICVVLLVCRIHVYLC